MVLSAREKYQITLLFFRGCAYIQQTIKKRIPAKREKQIRSIEGFKTPLAVMLYIILYLSYETLHYLMHKKIM